MCEKIITVGYCNDNYLLDTAVRVDLDVVSSMRMFDARVFKGKVGTLFRFSGQEVEKDMLGNTTGVGETHLVLRLTPTLTVACIQQCSRTMPVRRRVASMHDNVVGRSGGLVTVTFPQSGSDIRTTGPFPRRPHLLGYVNTESILVVGHLK